jgi:hypothetical protein
LKSWIDLWHQVGAGLIRAEVFDPSTGQFTTSGPYVASLTGAFSEARCLAGYCQVSVP